MAVPVQDRPIGLWARLPDRLDDQVGIGPDEAVPPRLERLHPLARGAQRDAGDPVPVRLLLHAAGIREHHARLRGERGKVEVAGRRHRAHARVERDSGGGEGGRRPGVGGEDHGLVDPRQCRGHAGERFRPGVRFPVQSQDDVAPRLDAGLLQRLRALAGDRREAEVGVVHDVADLVHALRDPLDGEVGDGDLRGAEEERGHAVDDETVQLLRHLPIEGAQAGLDVGDRDELLRSREGSRERRVRVPVDEDGVGTLLEHGALDPGEHARGLLRVGAGAALEPVGGRVELELLEEDRGELGIVVLARVERDLFDARVSKREGEGSRLDELRPVADDGKDSQAGGECSRTMTRRLLLDGFDLLTACYRAGKSVAWYGSRRFQRV